MNFGETVKAEIFAKLPKARPRRSAFLAGLIRGNGVLYETDDGYGLSFKIAGEERAFAVTEMIKSVFGFDVREIKVAEDRLHKREVAEINLTGGDADTVLKGLRIIEEKDGETVVVGADEKVYGNDDLFRAYLRGLFVSAGSCTVPNLSGTVKTGYHLEITFSHSSSCSLALASLMKHGINGSVTRRKESYVLYFKSAETIKDLIAFLPAPSSVLKFTDIMIGRELFNVTNRRKNCDLGNVNRQIEAQEKIIKAIDVIEKSGEKTKLSAELIETADARKKYAEDSLSELCVRLNVSKSCLNHRLRKIAEIAERITKENK